MALLFADSFPYDTPSVAAPKRWTLCYIGGGGASLVIQTTNGRFGGRWLAINGAGGGNACYVQRNLGAQAATVCVQFGFKATSYTDGSDRRLDAICTLLDSDGTAQATLVNNSGVLKAYRNTSTNGVLLGTAVPTMAPIGTWQQIEVKITINSTTGIFLVKVDGVTFLNLTSQNTQVTANSFATAVRFGGYGDAFQFGLSDVIVMDTSGSYCNDLLGIRRVKQCIPTADGNYKQFSRLSGSDNFEMVNEVPPTDDTDYNYTQTVGNKDSFVIPDVTAGSTVDAVVCSIYAKNADAVASTVKGLARSNGQDGLGTEQAVGASYNFAQSVIYVDPNTSAPFTAAAFNAAEFGYQKAS